MALDTLGVVSNEYRKRLLLRNLVNSDDADRLFHLGLAMTIPQQYTTQQSDTRQFIATAISIKNLIKNTFEGGGGGIGDNTTSRAFINQDYTYNKPYPLGSHDNEPLRNAEDQITEFPPPQRKTYNVDAYDKELNISNSKGGGQNMTTPDSLDKKVDPTKGISQFYWKQDNTFKIGDKKDLLSFTQSLLKNNTAGSVGQIIDQTITQYRESGEVDGDGNIKVNATKGSNIKDIDDPQKLAREFTVEKPYSTLGDLIRHEKPYMVEEGKTALGKNGFPRIAPTKEDSKNKTAPTNLMFSIENLAWQGYQSALPCLEKGPNKGRLMWFPPYGVTITDNSTVNWATTQFVGRGEPIYTYNHTERTMTLQFKVVTDHPSVLNAVKNQDRISINQFFSATGGKVARTIKQTLGLKYERIGEEQIDKAEVSIMQNERMVSLGSVNSSFSVPNDVNFTCLYSADTYSFIDNATGNTRNSLSPSDIVDKLYEVIDKVDIELIGSTSLNITQPAHCSGTTDTFDYSTQRATNFMFYMINELTAKNALTPNKDKQTAIDSMAGGPNSNTIIKTKADSLENCNFEFWQSLTVKTKYNPSRDQELITSGVKMDDLTPNTGLFLSKNTIPLCESEYFEAMQEDEKFALFNNLKSRLRYFQPAFHSMTPEGFNSRLTFLLQCTRQGPSIQQTKDSPSNMVFGRPPVCILRIGDFYYTKVVIDSVNISYDENLWDLNPEGIGIQPMIATVDLNMKVVGGSSLTRAVEKLQNALSYSFFANSEVYMGADFISGKIIDDKDKEVIAAREEKLKKEKEAIERKKQRDEAAAAQRAHQEFVENNPLSITGITYINHDLSGGDGTLKQKCESLKVGSINTIVNVKCDLNRAVEASDLESGDVILKATLVSNNITVKTLTKTIPPTDPHTDISFSFSGVWLWMDTTYNVKIEMVHMPSSFKVSENITLPSQSVYDKAGAIYGVTSGTTNPSYTQNPYCDFQQYWVDATKDSNINGGTCYSYWCSCSKTPSDTAMGSNKLSNCYIVGF